MRVAVTGTPGSGKTSATERLATDLEVIHLNDVIHEAGLTAGRDSERGTVVADLESLDSWLAGREDVLFESHLAHHFAADRVVVLRCHPAEIEGRLEARGEQSTTIEENAESEALDVILTEAVTTHGADSVYEIETTDRSPDGVATAIEAVVSGERDPAAGTVSFLDYL